MTYQSKREPRAKQREALDLLKGHDAFALLMAMRTGKTKVVLDDWGKLAASGSVSGLLVIAPAGVYRTWETAIREDLGVAATVYTWVSGGKSRVKAKASLAAFTQASGPRILLMNVEALSSVAEARELTLTFLAADPTMTVIDESVIIKNPSSKRTKFIVDKLAPLSKYRRILSGLPTPRSPLDLYTQFAFLNPNIIGIRSFWAFKNRYAILKPIMVGGRMIRIVDGYRDTEQLQRLIAPHSFRCRLEDCYDLPASDYSIRGGALTDEQRRIYSSLKQFATASLANEKHITATIVITQILRLHQVLCGIVTDEEGNTHHIPEHRTAELLSLLDDYDGKAIVWCSYDANIRHVAAALEKEYGAGSVARFWGGNATTREEEEIQFKTNPACRFMVATASAGGRGRTWHGANLVIYYSNTYDLDHRSQSEERVKAVGKTTQVAYVDLVARETIDEKIINVLRSKIDMAATITGDAWREWLV